MHKKHLFISCIAVVVAIFAISVIYLFSGSTSRKNSSQAIAISTEQKLNSNYLQAMELYQQKKIVEAEPPLQQEADRKNIHAYGPLGHIKLITGDDVQAEKYLLLALDNRDDPLIDNEYTANTMCNLGSVYYNLKNFSKARQYWEAAAAMGFGPASEKLKLLNEKK